MLRCPACKEPVDLMPPRDRCAKCYHLHGRLGTLRVFYDDELADDALAVYIKGGDRVTVQPATGDVAINHKMPPQGKKP